MTRSAGRKYWIFSKQPINAKIFEIRRQLNDIPLTSPPKLRAYRRDKRARLLKELKDLESRRFLDIGSFVIQNGGLFMSEKTIPLYLYSQESDVLEFFSGIKVGTYEHAATHPGYCYLRGPYSEFWLGLPPAIFIDGSLTPPYAREVDAATFAAEVKPLLSQREYIASIIREQFNKINVYNQRLKDMKEREESAKDARNADAEEFLNGLF